MDVNPYVIGILPNDTNHYGGPLQAAPSYDGGELPRYAADDLWRFKYRADEVEKFDTALEFLHDQSLTAEVKRYRETSLLTTRYQQEIRKIEERLYKAGQLKDGCVRRLEAANALSRIEAAVEELGRRADQQANRERGRSS